MRAVVWDGSNGIEGLRIEQRPEPELVSGHVLVSMRAASLNYRDLMILNGQYRVRVQHGFVPLSDGAGEVVGVADDVVGFQIGDRVMSLFYPRWQAGRVNREVISDQPGGTRDGMLAELVLFPASGLLKVPSSLSYEEAATFPCAGVTAWASLQGHVPVKPGDTVLTLGSGGVSLFAFQFAKLAGATVIMTTSRDENAERLRDLGVDHVINYCSDPQWHKTVRTMFPSGVDHVIENGGIGSLSQSVQATSIGGVVNLLGVLTDPESFQPASMAWAFCDIRKITVGNTADAQGMLRAVGTHTVCPIIDSVFPFERSSEAFAYLSSQSHIGKVVISIQS